MSTLNGTTAYSTIVASNSISLNTSNPLTEPRKTEVLFPTDDQSKKGASNKSEDTDQGVHKMQSAEERHNNAKHKLTGFNKKVSIAAGALFRFGRSGLLGFMDLLFSEKSVNIFFFGAHKDKKHKKLYEISKAVAKDLFEAIKALQIILKEIKKMLIEKINSENEAENPPISPEYIPIPTEMQPREVYSENEIDARERILFDEEVINHFKTIISDYDGAEIITLDPISMVPPPNSNQIQNIVTPLNNPIDSQLNGNDSVSFNEAKKNLNPPNFYSKKLPK
jgi:hypothetical protein